MVRLYDEIAPSDLVVRHRWLFRDGWPEPPIRRWKPGVHQRTEVVEADVETNYWERCNPNMWVRAGEADFEFVVRKLCDAGRPSMALLLGHFEIKKMDGHLLIDVLEQFSREPETDLVSAPGTFARRSIIYGVDRHRLALLEFRLFEALGFEGGRHAKSLYAEITTNPRVFAEIIYMVYKPQTRTEEPEIGERQRELAGHAWRILIDCEAMPGTAHDETFDPKAFTSFIVGAQRLCAEADRLDSCNSVLGQILSHAPADSDGVWPFGPARPAYAPFYRQLHA